MLASWTEGATKSAIVDFVALGEALDQAAQCGITVESMKRAWQKVSGPAGEA